MYVFKKNLNLLIIVCFVISFNLIAHTLWSNYFCTAGHITIPDTTNTTKTGNINPILTGSTVIARTKLSTEPKTIEITTGWEDKTTVKEWTKPLLVWQVNAYYEWETTYERVRNQIIKLWVSYEIAEHITWEAYANTEDPKLFIKNIIWVSNAEWWIFKHWLHNNYLGVMACSNLECHLRHYETVQASITNWRELYNKNKWYVRTTAQRWLDGKYCASDCTHRVQNYNEWVYLLNI